MISRACPPSVNGEGEPRVRGAALLPSSLTEREVRGVRFEKMEDGAGHLNAGVVPLSCGREEGKNGGRASIASSGILLGETPLLL